ncbi:MAG: hypothetical protein WC372_09655 [Candidatus Neomarinimicrobiota bacterium]
MKVVEINGKKVSMKFTWRQLAQVEEEFGDSPNLFNYEILARVAAIGIDKPEWTPERIIEASPPMVPFIRAVDEAVKKAYFGNEAIPKETEKKSLLAVAGLCRHIARLFRRG